MTRKCITPEDYRNIIHVPHEGIYHHEIGPAETEALEKKLTGDPRIASLLIPAECIDKRNHALASEICSDYKNVKDIEILVVLTGAFIYAGDMGRALYNAGGVNARFHMIKTSVYDKTIKTSGESYRAVEMKLAPRDIDHRDILIVEDITDQGFTMTWLTDYLANERRVNSMKICSLLTKRLANPSEEVKKIRRELTVDYTGFDIEDIWISGYGIDTAHDLRNIPHIVGVNEEHFAS